jgi:hypothetical protein
MPAFIIVDVVLKTDWSCVFTVVLYQAMKQQKPTKTSEKTRLQYLVRNKSGCYYARVYVDGKEVWKSLATSHFRVAKAKPGAISRASQARQP